MNDIVDETTEATRRTAMTRMTTKAPRRTAMTRMITMAFSTLIASTTARESRELVNFRFECINGLTDHDGSQYADSLNDIVDETTEATRRTAMTRMITMAFSTMT
jgi:hypothetical protein